VTLLFQQMFNMRSIVVNDALQIQI